MIQHMTSGEYHAHPALSHSRLKLMGRSPAHFRHFLTSEKESTEALDFGRLFHATVLEPESVQHEFVTMPSGIDRRTKVGKEEYAKFMAEAVGRTVVTEEQMATAEAMAKSISDDTAANEIVFDAVATGRLEEAHVWRDRTHAVDRKAKFDAVLKDSTVIDLKTTTDASPTAFARSIAQYGYHTQAAWYADALEASGSTMRRFVIVAVEKNPPFAVGVYVLDQPSISAGRKRIEEWLFRYAECMSNNRWPGYTPTARLISIPAWSLNEEGTDGGW
jgi:hypothetical protein